MVDAEGSFAEELEDSSTEEHEDTPMREHETSSVKEFETVADGGMGLEDSMDLLEEKGSIRKKHEAFTTRGVRSMRLFCRGGRI